MTHRDEKPAGTRYGFPADAKGFLFAPILWALFFVASYSIQGAGCAMGWNRPSLFGLDAIQLALLALTLLVLVVLAVVGLWSWRAYRAITIPDGDTEAGDRARQSRFLAAGAALNAGLFFAACLWTGIPVLWSQTCGGLS